MTTKPCARSGGATVAACHYVWCRKNKACVERPENAKRIIATLHQPQGVPHGKETKPSRKARHRK